MQVEVYDSSDTLLGVVDRVFTWSNTAKLDKAGSFSFTVASSNRKTSLLVSKRIVKCYRIIGGSRTLVGSGIIDKITIRVRGGKVPIFNVEGDSIERELVYRSVFFEKLEDGSGGGVGTALADIIAYAPSGWIVDASGEGYSTTLNDVYAQFAGESVLKAFVKIAEKTGEHFRFEGGRGIVWLRDDTPDSGITARQNLHPDAVKSEKNCLITALQVQAETFDVASRVYPYGAGNGDVRLTLAATNRVAGAGYTLDKTNNYLKRDDTETAFGRIDDVRSFKDVAPISNTAADIRSAANTLFDLAKEYLDQHKEAVRQYSISVTGLDKIVYPGQTIRVEYYKYINDFEAINIDEDLIVLGSTSVVSDKGVRTVQLTVSTVPVWLTQEARYVASKIEQGTVLEAHPQLNANSYIISYDEMMDDNYDVNARFWFGAEVTQLQQVLFRFRIDPLRSPSKGVASGGGATSGSGGATTSSSSGAHYHQLVISNVAKSYPVSFDGGSGTALLGSTAPSIGYVNTGGASTNHTHTIGDHTHTTPDHIHSLQFGIFEETSGNTLVETDLSYSINGSSPTNSVTSLGSGWYALDLTPDVQDSVDFRPDQESNVLVISTSTAKTARIVAQLLVRNVIQAIAVT